MKRKFCDLHLCINLNGPRTQGILARAARLGYKQISVPFLTPPTQTDLSNLKSVAQTSGLDLVVRADFKPRNQEDLTRFLRRYRRQFEVICVICDNKDVSRQAAKDHRVDILNFPNVDYKKRFFDRAEAELASCTQAMLEVDIKPLLVLDGPPRTRFLSTLRREYAIAQEYNIPIIISSGVNEETFMRKPRDMASLSYLFGLQETQALDAVSSNPSALVEHNRQKLNPKYVAPGINVIKEGKPDETN